MNWGSKPFKKNSSWIQRLSFIPLVQDCWNSSVIRGKQIFIFKKEKLLRLKVSLKNWNNVVFRMHDLDFEDDVLDLRKLDDLAASDPESVSTSDFGQDGH